VAIKYKLAELQREDDIRRQQLELQEQIKIAIQQKKLQEREKMLQEAKILHQRRIILEHELGQQNSLTEAELQAEIARLRSRVHQMESPQEPDTGSLTYEVPPREEVPLGTLHSTQNEAFPASTERSERVAVSESSSSGDGGPCDDGERIDIDTEMPYGELEPFGREDTAQELTESSIKESDEMVDQLERAEVAEEKRAVFRALTRLRGAAITSFDGIARSQTGNIDEYNKIHKWRRTHPLHHLADEESDISKWAFPDNADF